MLDDFAAAHAPEADRVIGTADVAINGGQRVAGVWSEARVDRDYELGMQQELVEFTCVLRTSVFEAGYPDRDLKQYLGKTAVRFGREGQRNLTVAAIDRGDFFTRVMFHGKQQAP